MTTEQSGSQASPYTVIEYEGESYLYTWVPETDFTRIQPYNLVSTVCFDSHGDVLISCQKDIWRLPGGGPEPSDYTPDRTAAREFEDETNVSLKNMALLGGFKIDKVGGGDKPFYQLIYYAEVDVIHPRTLSKEENEIFHYEFVPFGQVNQKIGWKETGAAMLVVANKHRHSYNP